MDMHGIGSVQIPTGIYGMDPDRPVGGSNECSGYSDSTEKLDISPSGKMINAIAQMSEEERAEMNVFHQEMMDSMMNGTFDVSELAASAPESLKAIAEESGIDLEQMIQDMASGPPKSEGAPPPPPPGMYMSDGSAMSFMENYDSNLLGNLFTDDEIDTDFSIGES